MSPFLRKCFLAVVFLPATLSAQTMRISGNVQDTAVNAPLQYAVVMVVRLNDSLLTAYTRTNNAGDFELPDIPLDTYQVSISHPRFGEQMYYVLGSKTNNSFDFGKIILPPKDYVLNEVIIYAFKDPIYYKGDTLIFTADSFKVKKNATVEDLLKKLPGISVDKLGKITVQGKQVDQVLVDGDEFFGADPTVATKNLSATDLQSVQVYDKKNENAGANTEDLKIMNLLLKDKVKNGYFGKLSGAGDFSKFYEGDLLVNRFSGNRKVSLFALTSNTPRDNVEFWEMMKYGMFDMQSMESGDGFFTSNFESYGDQGVPKTIRGGIYFSDKWGKNTKVNANYAYSSIDVEKHKESRAHYFLTDTNYFSNTNTISFQKNDMHSIDMKITQTLDSLTECVLTSKFKSVSTTNNNYEMNDFISENDTLTRRTINNNEINRQSYNNNSKIQITRSFKKKERKLTLNYSIGLASTQSEGILQTTDEYFFVSQPNDSINQQKTGNVISQSHNASVVYKEPITNKIKLEFSYGFIHDKNLQNKQTLDFVNGSYSLENPQLSNDFETVKYSNSAGGKFIFETSKHTFNMGANYRQIAFENVNLVSQEKISYPTNNILPTAFYRCKFTKNEMFTFTYNTDLKQPAVNQLQPVPDNSNTNRIYIGNPNLVPSFTHDFRMRYSNFKPVSNRTVWGSLGYSVFNNAFSNNISYDTLGRSVTQPINVNGNYNAYSYLGFEFPVIKNRIKIKPNLSFNYNSNTNYINSAKNITTTAAYRSGITLSRESEKYEIEGKASYDYNIPKSTLNTQNSNPYYSQEYTAEMSIQLWKKFSIKSDVSYRLNNGQTEGYDINYMIWNISLNKTLLKQENLILSLNAYDLLDQNIATERSVQDNIITDTKTSIINRYFLLKAIYKFKDNKSKDEGDGF